MSNKQFYINLFIDIIIAAVLAATLWVSCRQSMFMGKSVDSQVKFNDIAIRPWLGIEDVNINNITEDTLINQYKIELVYITKNYGNTPALKVISANVINYDKEFIIAIDKDAQTSSPIFPQSIIFVETTKETKILKDNPILYIHIIVMYKDINGKEYSTRTTYHYNKYTQKIRSEKSIIDQ